MTHAPVRAVDTLGIHAIELTHSLGKVRIGCFDHHMIVIGHLTIGMTHPIETPADVGKYFKPRYAIFVRKKNVLTPVSTRGDVVESAGKL